MTCRVARKRLVDLFDTAEPEGAAELRAHLAQCHGCAEEYRGMQAALAAIEPPVRVQASPDFKERVMNKAMQLETPVSRRHTLFPRLAFAAVAVAALVLFLPSIGSIGARRGQAPGPVLSLLAQSVQAMSGLRSFHLSARMRTLPNDNFEYISAECDWVPLEIWREYGNPPRWRVEKTGRIVVMDGTSSTLLIKPAHMVRGTPRAGFLEWMRVLLDTDQIIDNELRTARAGLSEASLTEETRNGVRQLVLTVNRKTGWFLRDDWLRNKSVSSSDHTRVYRFDPITKRLDGMQVILHAQAGDVSVFEVTGIRYDEPLDPALFSLAPPENAIWYVPPEQMPPSDRLPKTAKEAAALFFDALSREDWAQALLVYPHSGVSPEFKQQYGGLQVVSLGEPFRSWFYPGWFVPYEIKLKSGYVKKHNLAVRNDNSVRRWVQDGGL